MLEHLRLTWIERIALRILCRSERIGLLVIKRHSSRMVFIVRDESDPVDITQADEPVTMQLERLYHQPSYGEDE
jgi:hypothetical protein